MSIYNEPIDPRFITHQVKSQWHISYVDSQTLAISAPIGPACSIMAHRRVKLQAEGPARASSLDVRSVHVPVYEYTKTNHQ